MSTVRRRARPRVPVPADMAAGLNVRSEYATRWGGCHVLLGSPKACLDVLEALELAVLEYGRLGLAVPSRIRFLIRLLDLELADYAPTSGSGNPELPHEPVLRVSAAKSMTSAEAAQALGLTSRQVRNLAEQLGGRRVGRSWSFDRAVIAAEAAKRRSAHATHWEAGNPADDDAGRLGDRHQVDGVDFGS